MVRIAVIGTGGWGKNHVRVLSELGHLVAVCDLDASRAAAYAEKYRVKGYSAVDEMLEKEKPDGVTICTPASTHFAVATKTLRAGVHTFVEKPMTSTVKEAQDLIKEAERAGKILTVGFIERFNPAIAEQKKMITEGTLGFISQEIQVHEEAGTKVPKHVVQEPLMLELKGYATAIAEGRQPLVSGK